MSAYGFSVGKLRREANDGFGLVSGPLRCVIVRRLCATTGQSARLNNALQESGKRTVAFDSHAALFAALEPFQTMTEAEGFRACLNCLKVASDDISHSFRMRQGRHVPSLCYDV